MFGSVSRTIYFLARTPLIPATPTGPAMVELSNLSGPSRRPRAASRTLSNMSMRSAQGYVMESRRGYASDRGKQELYSDETGSVGAGIDDVAHTDAAFDKDPNPNSSAKKVEQETGKDFTSQSSPNAKYSEPYGKQGDTKDANPLNTSKFKSEKK